MIIHAIHEITLNHLANKNKQLHLWKYKVFIYLNILTNNFHECDSGVVLKASLLKRLKQGSEASESSSSSASDTNTFYEDDFSSPEDSTDEDEDSEPLLGQWLEDTLSPLESVETIAPPPVPARSDAQGEGRRSRKISTEDPSTLIPDKKDPQGVSLLAYLLLLWWTVMDVSCLIIFTNTFFIIIYYKYMLCFFHYFVQFVTLASDILNFLSVYFINTPDMELQKLIKSTLNEDHMSNLAILIRELDRDCIRIINGKSKVHLD